MSVQAVQPSAEHAHPPGTGAGDRTLVLPLPKANQTGAPTIAARRERAVVAPALTVCELQLARDQVERVPIRQPDRSVTLGYRLPTAPASEPPDVGR